MTQQSPDGAQRLYRRAAVKLVPFLLLCYIVAMIDRLNVGFAKLQFVADLHFDDAVFGMAAGILYIGYIIFELPSNLALERFGVRVTLLRIMILWGLATMAMAFAASRGGFYAAQFLIGAGEAGFFPGVLYYLTLWFPSRWRALITSLFALGVPISGVVAGPASGWIMTHMTGVEGMRGWQWLFLIEGAPAVLLGLAAWFYLPDRPSAARFFSAAEAGEIARDLERQEPRQTCGDTFAQTLRRPRAYVLAFVYFAFYSAQSVLLLWVPTLLRDAGVRNLVEIGWRSALVFCAGGIGMALAGWHSDRTQERRLHLTFCGLTASAAYLALPLAAARADATTLVLMIAAVGVFSFLALFWTIPTQVFGPGARAGVIALISSIGASGSALSPTFVGWMKVLTGGLFGAIDMLALFFAFSLIALNFCLPARGNDGFATGELQRTH